MACMGQPTPDTGAPCAAFYRPGRTRCEAERGSAAGRPQLHLQPPVLEFGDLRPVLSLLVPSCWFANGLQDQITLVTPGSGP